MTYSYELPHPPGAPKWIYTERDISDFDGCTQDQLLIKENLIKDTQNRLLSVDEEHQNGESSVCGEILNETLRQGNGAESGDEYTPFIDESYNYDDDDVFM